MPRKTIAGLQEELSGLQGVLDAERKAHDKTASNKIQYMSELKEDKIRTSERIWGSGMGTVSGAVAPVLEIAAGTPIGPSLYLINAIVGTGLGLLGGSVFSRKDSNRGVPYGATFGLATSLALSGLADLAQHHAYKNASVAEIRLIETQEDRSITYKTNDGNVYHNPITDQGVIPFEDYRASNLESLSEKQGTEAYDLNANQRIKLQATRESWDQRLDAMNKAWEKATKSASDNSGN
jgi:hypothetical protein